MPVPGPLRIRRRLAADDEFIYQLGAIAFAEYGSDAGRRTYAMAVRGVTLVAERRALPVGFAVVEPPIDGLAHLVALAVTEEARGRGVGQTLLRAVEDLSVQRGARRIHLVTADSNLAALALFLDNGFSRSRQSPRRYPRGQRALVLGKNVARRRAAG